MIIEFLWLCGNLNIFLAVKPDKYMHAAQEFCFGDGLR